MKSIMMFSIAMSSVFMQSSHPIMLMIIILTQTILLALIIWIVLKTNWFSYIMFLIFLGGLMVLFIYISSLAANEMFYFKPNTYMHITLGLMIIFMFMSMFMNNQMTLSSPNMMSSTLVVMISKSMLMMSLSTMLYLLLTLIVVVKLTSKYKGPLRNLIF
uniref:NADH dehydrogenase subunit 6 n=1 Tax=Metisotoma macnamarai TaxID=2682814 RepID=A0A650DQ41_9HEXA|nr:NADH dehydrogenase subunit 6 [Metisotoma macnamarai]